MFKTTKQSYLLPKTPVVLALYAVAFALIFSAPPRWELDSGLASLIDKHQRLKSIESSKIVLIGGSNVSTGIDSAAIESVLGREVVNMGLGASLGLRYMLEEVRGDIKAGDLFVILPEYNYFATEDTLLNGSSDLFNLAIVYPEARKWVANVYLGSPLRFMKGLQDLLGFISFKRNFYIDLASNVAQGKKLFSISESLKPTNTIYTHRTNYNKYGDFIGHLDLKAPGFPYVEYLNYSKFCYSKEADDVLAGFAQFAKERGARVVLIPPPFPNSQRYLDRARAISSKWTGIQNLTVLGSTDRYTFAYADFFDTPYHMNASGRQKRTKLILQDLQEFISSSNQKVASSGQVSH